MNGLRILKVTLLSLKKSFSEIYRRSCPQCSVKKNDLKIFTKFTGTLFCWSFVFVKVAGLRFGGCNLIKQETPTQMLSCEFCEQFCHFYQHHLLTAALLDFDGSE